MSAPLWTIIVAGWDGHEPESPADLRFVTVKCPDALVAQKALNALNAFDALLAVAKAVAEKHDRSMLLRGESEYTRKEWDGLRALDAAFPGWREWTA